MKTTKTNKTVRVWDGSRHFDRVVFVDQYGEFVKVNKQKQHIRMVREYNGKKLYEAGLYRIEFIESIDEQDIATSEPVIVEESNCKDETACDKTRAEKYAENWFTENGFEFKLIKQYISKTKYIVKKDGVSDEFELPAATTEPKKYMELYRKSFELKCQLENMRK